MDFDSSVQEYIPSKLRQQQVEVVPQYIVVTSSGGCTDGPFKTEIEALEVIPEENSEIFLSGNQAGQGKLLWKFVNNKWIRHKVDLVLTRDQVAALANLHRWLKTDKPYFILKGYAGTGKTSILKTFLQEISKSFSVCLTSPTNKAAQLLQEVTGLKTATTFSALGLRMSQDEDKLVLTSGKKVYFPPGSLLILDEAGMVGSDLCNAITTSQINFKLKVLFVGDPAQLNPVKEKRSKIWKLADKEDKSFLKEIVRCESNLERLSTATRQCLIDKVFDNPFTDYVDNKSVIQLYSQTFTQVASEEVAKDPKHNKIIAWRNSTVDRYNNSVRTYLGFTSRFNVGEYVMLAASIERNDIIVAHKDEEFIVTSINTSEIIVEFRSEEWTIPVYELGVKNTRTLLLSVPVDQDRLDSVLNRIASSIRKRKAVKEWPVFWEIKNRFNSVRYAYALTAHRAQGSTYRDVYVDQKDILSNKEQIESFRCLYVAFTRASSSLTSF